MAKVNECPICRVSPLNSRLFELPVFRHVDFSTIADRVELQLCGTCGVVISRNFFPDEKQLFKRASYHKTGLAGRSKISSKAGVGRSRAGMQVKLIDKILNHPSPVVLDIGCFNGELLCELAAHYDSADLTGVDVVVSPRCEAIIHRRMTFSSDLEGALERKYDLIVISHTISYLSNLPKILPRLASALSKDGYLYIQMPDVTKNPYYLLMGDQYFTFTPDSLRYVLCEYGFDVCVHDAPEFSRETVIIAKHRRSRVGRCETRIPGLREVEGQFEALLKKIGRGTVNEGPSQFGVFGTTVNAAFVDELIGNQQTFFVDDDPFWEKRQFRGRYVKRPEELKRIDKIFFPYEPEMQVKVASRTKAHLILF